MNFETVESQELVEAARSLVLKERKLTTEILRHLREIERRKIFAERGFSSLHEFAVKDLGYSDGAAFRRISSMRLIKDIPEAEEALQAGRLSLSTASAVQCFFRAEKARTGKAWSPGAKLELLQVVEHKSKRECEMLFATLAPQPPTPDRVRPVSEHQVEFQFRANKSLLKKLEEIRAHSMEAGRTDGYGELFELLADLALKQIKAGTSAANEVKSPTKPESPGIAETEDATSPEKLASGDTEKLNSRYIPVSVRRIIWRRDQGRCTHVDLQTTRRCQARTRLQMDHIWPFAKGGMSSPENLRLLCPAHNAWAAIRSFGVRKMARHVPDLDADRLSGSG